MSNMFIYLICIFFLFTFSNADYLNTKSTNQCIYNVEPYQGHKGLCYTKRSNNQNICNTKLKYKDLIDGYEYVNSGCYLKHDLAVTGLTENQFNENMTIAGNLVGFSFMFLILFIATLMGRK